MKPIAVIAASVLLLSACQSTDYIGNEDSYRYRIPTGSTLVLNKPIVIPSDRSTVYIFRGEVVTYKKVDIYYPHCQLRMKKISSQARTINPDTFAITRINDWEDYHASGSSRVRVTLGFGVRIGTSGHIGVGFGSGGRGGPSIIKYATIISLRSDSQSDVKDMICAQWGDQGGIEAVTIHETRDALGDIFTLNIKTKQKAEPTSPYE